MNCATCINNYEGKTNCYSMTKKPKNKWCHMDQKSAIKAEWAVINYNTGELNKSFVIPQAEKAQLRTELARANKRLRILEGLNDK